MLRSYIHINILLEHIVSVVEKQAGLVRKVPLGNSNLPGFILISFRKQSRYHQDFLEQQLGVSQAWGAQLSCGSPVVYR